LILSNLYGAHRDESVWQDPDEFKVEHFLDQDGNLTNTENFIPFSAGRRQCPGLPIAKAETFTYLVTAMQRFNLSIDPEGRSEEELKPNRILNHPDPDQHMPPTVKLFISYRDNN